MIISTCCFWAVYRRFAGDQDHVTFAGLCLAPAPQQQFDFFLSPHKGSQASRPQRLEAALEGPRPNDSPSPCLPSDALEILRPKVLYLEEGRSACATYVYR